MRFEMKKYKSLLVERKKVSIGVALLIVGASAMLLWNLPFGRASENGKQESDGASQKNVAGIVPEVAVVGDTIDGLDSSSASWAGEILSLGNLSVQPQRDGALVEWKVRIGDRVREGQTLAVLSAPPLMPDVTKMLAEQAEMLTRARAEAQATKKFTEANNEQLTKLLSAVGNAIQDSQAILIGDSSSLPTVKDAVDKAKRAADTMQQNVRSFLTQTIATHLRIVANGTAVTGSLPTGWKSRYGQIDMQNQIDYETAYLNLVLGLRNTSVIPFDAAQKYFRLAVRLGDTSIAVDGVDDIKEMMRDDQNEYLDMVSKYQDALAEVTMKEVEYRLMSVDQGKMYAQDRKMIEEKIAENEKMSAMADAEAKAAEVAYASVSQGLSGGLYVTAPRAGVISTIMAKVGQFVGPGMPVATINAGHQDEQFVRFRIPGNVRLPEIGITLTMIRPGFPQDKKKVKLLGIGTTLESGTYMADATFLEQVNWPPDASVRVVTEQSASTPVIKVSAISWKEEGKPFVWVVSKADRIFAKQISVGRTLGTYIEVYDGLSNGDRYVVNPDPSIREDMLLEDLIPKGSTNQPASGKGDGMGDMGM